MLRLAVMCWIIKLQWPRWSFYWEFETKQSVSVSSILITALNQVDVFLGLCSPRWREECEDSIHNAALNYKP